MILPVEEESIVAINIKDAETDAKARELAAITGESITVAIRKAVEQRLRRESMRQRSGAADRILAIADRLSNRPRLSTERAEQILGYDEDGLPQ